MLVLHRRDLRHLRRQGRLLSERVLVTGALGCVGAWTLKAALDAGDEAFGFDLGDRTHRLELVLTPEERERVTLVQGDITDLERLGRVLDEHRISRIVHLAALQVPFCRADPVLGARVNVVGTVNVLEAVKQRLDRIPGVAYASSAAVTGLMIPRRRPSAAAPRLRRSTGSRSRQTKRQPGSTGPRVASRRSASAPTSSMALVATRG